jgi:ribulose-5-phosphate 4-epimerase/fuculose-1-phosphate aldolase
VHGKLDVQLRRVERGDHARHEIRPSRGAEAVILRNHGLLVPGRSMAQAFFHLYRLEQACRYQIQAMATGAPIITAPAGRLDEIRLQFWTMTHIDNDGSREWPGLFTKLDCLDPSYRN